MRSWLRGSASSLGLITASVLWVATLTVARASVPAQSNSSGGKKPAAVAKSVQTKNPAATATGGTYVGEEKCLVCHEPQREKYENSAHHRSVDSRTPAAAQSCETCHGPGSKHVDDPTNNKMFDFKKAKSDDANATCTSCHNKGEHALWDGSKHEARGLACTTCHSVHAYESEKGQLKAKTQLALCGTCHRDKVAKLESSGHMPVREGKLECSSCHNMHGSTNVKLLRTGDTVSEACTSCHAEKRGPYLWEHAPVREGCTTCHDAHGSSNERMLVAKLPMLCQRCHISSRHPPTVYDQTQINSGSNRLLSRSCVNCHAAIHGSDHPAGAMFLR